MAKATQVTETVTTTTVMLILNEEEAGYLLDLLSGHVGGPLTLDPQPLGRIRCALDRSGVKRLYACKIAFGSMPVLSPGVSDE